MFSDAVEAVRAAAGFAFEQPRWPTIGHTINPANTASIAVAQSSGSRRLRPVTVTPPPGDHRADL